MEYYEVSAKERKDVEEIFFSMFVDCGEALITESKQKQKKIEIIRFGKCLKKDLVVV